ncbi:MAG TPA: hypothetical protein VEW05_18650 [Candidatus Polarisedimenticolia bacterium]|nr:hypothetical protein [Candidatus Polarisedimenticolia bacterium]
MNDDELRQRQLARLRGIDPPIAGSALEFVPDPELDADYASYCKSQRDWEREQKPRDVWEREHRELMQRLNVQPENPLEESPFVVTNRRDEYGDLQALPAPRWPSPGQPKTTAISRAHFEEGMLQSDANHALTDCVRWLAGKLRDPDSWDDPYSGPPSKLYETPWSFLMGTWRARGIEPPSELRMNQWAKEYNEATKRRAKPETEVECKEDLKSLAG